MGKSAVCGLGTIRSGLFTFRLTSHVGLIGGVGSGLRAVVRQGKVRFCEGRRSIWTQGFVIVVVVVYVSCVSLGSCVLCKGK
jgi:hypothetical protein